MCAYSIEESRAYKSRLDLYTGPIPVNRQSWLDEFFQNEKAENQKTIKHSKNVAFYGAKLAEFAGFDFETIQLTYLSALVHDRGKFQQKYDYSTHPEKGAELLRRSQFLHENFSQEERSVMEFVAQYHHGLREEMVGNIPLENTRGLCNDPLTKDAFPVIKDWNRLYDILMVIMMADQFASMTDPRDEDETERTNGQRRYTFYEAFILIIEQFEGFSEKEEIQLKLKQKPRLEKFDGKFYKVFLKFGDYIVRNEKQFKEID